VRHAGIIGTVLGFFGCCPASVSRQPVFIDREPSLLRTQTGVSGIDRARPSANEAAKPMAPCM
jgi:hypothetical protein